MERNGIVIRPQLNNAIDSMEIQRNPGHSLLTPVHQTGLTSPSVPPWVIIPN